MDHAKEAEKHLRQAENEDRESRAESALIGIGHALLALHSTLTYISENS